ncbi:MAG: hypothetical protein ICV64_02625 [Thermoleophilia bacterium]|nr:hypothetical protein [Thermoleophilia bacterium]
MRDERPDEARAAAEPRMGEPGYFPDEDAIRRAEFTATTPVERVMEGIALSRLGTRVALAGREA